jgi:hypothetical protein
MKWKMIQKLIKVEIKLLILICCLSKIGFGQIVDSTSLKVELDMAAPIIYYSDNNSSKSVNTVYLLLTLGVFDRDVTMTIDDIEVFNGELQPYSKGAGVSMISIAYQPKRKRNTVPPVVKIRIDGEGTYMKFVLDTRYKNVRISHTLNRSWFVEYETSPAHIISR